MTKICMLKYVVSYGGASKVAIKVANELQKNHEIHFVNLHGQTDTKGNHFHDSIKVVDLNTDAKNLKKDLFKLVRRVRKYLKSNDFDIVMGVGVTSYLVTILSTRGMNLKTVMCDHNSLAAGNHIGKYYRLQRYIGTKFGDKVVVLTEESHRDFQKKYHLSADHFKVIHNWIDNDNVVPNHLNTKRILTAGRMDRQKGYDLLLPIAKRVLKKHPDWTWHICGGGDSNIKNQILDYLEKNNLNDRLVLEGVVADMDKMYRESELYVMTSRYEGLPLVLLEAKQRSLPIVAYNCQTGPSDIIRDGVNGFIVDQNDEDQMVEKINQLIEDRELREKFSGAAKLDIDKFNKEKIVAQWEELIEEMTK